MKAVLSKEVGGPETLVVEEIDEPTPGKGEVDFGLLGETLDKYGYQGNVTLETEYKNYHDVTEVDVENRFAIEHLKSVGWDVGLR